MNNYLKKITTVVASLLIAFVITVGFFAPVKAEAASFTSSKPKFDAKKCAYLNNVVYLKWSKVTGAKSYEIQRAWVNPSTGKVGKWKKWAVVKGKTYIKKKDSGDYKYRVRAINGKQKSKWSAWKRIFAATAKITHMGYTEPDVMFGVTLHEGQIEFRALVTNKTKSPMGFVDSGTRFGNQNTLYALNKKTGKVVKKWDAYIDLGDISTIAKKVEAGKSQSLYFYAFVTAEEWAKVKNCKFMVTSAFYPNPEVEDISTEMAISYTKNIKDSAVAAK